MKNFLTSLIISLSCLPAHAQQNRFIYLQTENKQSFFVKIDNRIFNSYPLGYLIIPKLEDSIYSLIIGFPETNYEQEFSCSVKNKDVGFIIKNAGEKQWQLLNMQTLAVINPGAVVTKSEANYEKETDPFSTMLANAVHDSTILRKDIAKEVLPEKKEQDQKDTNVVAVINNASIVKPDSLLKDSANKDIAKEIFIENAKAPNKNDTTISNANLVIVKGNSIIPDSIKNSADIIFSKGNIAINDSAKKVITISDEIKQKDTTQTFALNDKAIAKNKKFKKNNKAINNAHVSKKETAILEKPKENTDTVRTVLPGDIAVSKIKYKRSKKNNNVLKDSSVMQKQTVIIPEKIKENTDTIQNVNSTAGIKIVRSSIKRKLKKSGRDGLQMVYVDDTGDAKDTINVLIPVDKKKKKSEPVITATAVDLTVVKQNNIPEKESPVLKNKDEYKITDQEKQIIAEANKQPVVKSTMINSDCKNFASEDDFLKIRKKMVAENTDENMIKAARKFFKAKCFTTEQIKNLSVLFLKDESKYNFFDTAYPFVSDSDLYFTLEKQLSDNYYITRFRSMIHK